MPILLTHKDTTGSRLSKKLLRGIMHYMKEITLGLCIAFIGLFAGLVGTVADRIYKGDYSPTSLTFILIDLFSLLAAAVFMAWTIRIGTREDRERKQEANEREKREIEKHKVFMAEHQDIINIIESYKQRPVDGSSLS